MLKHSSERSDNSNPKSCKETRLILELRARLQNSNSELKLEHEKLNNDNFLQRYLSESKWDVEKAESVLNNYVKINKEIDLESLKDKKFPQDFGNVYKLFVGGSDYKNRPVALVLSFGGDLSPILERAKSNEEELRQQFFELSVKHNMLMEKSILERNVENGVCIVDVSKTKYWQLLGKKAIEFQLNNFKRMQEHSPGLVGKVILVNAPKIAKAVLKLAQKLVSFSTEVVIYHSGEDWKKELRKHVPEDAVPAHFGGTMENCEEVVSNYVL